MECYIKWNVISIYVYVFLSKEDSAFSFLSSKFLQNLLPRNTCVFSVSVFSILFLIICTNTFLWMTENSNETAEARRK